MSTPNPLAHEPKREPIVPTEAHRKLVRAIRDRENGVEFDITEHFAAQRIAESEARALAAHDAVYQRACEVEHELRAELTQLRAQVALDEKAKALMLREHFKDVDKINQLRAAKCPHVVTDREGTSHCSLAERDGRELAKERARLDWLESQGEPITYEDAPHSVYWGVYGAPGERDMRKVIDAAMKAKTP